MRFLPHRRAARLLVVFGLCAGAFALPNVADTAIWPTVGRLEANMVWVAGAILPTTLIIATTRDTALSLSFRAHPGNALLRVIGAVFFPSRAFPGGAVCVVTTSDAPSIA